MGSLSPRLQVRVAQKQILTPGLVQMVSLLQLNRLELKEMISAEVAQNPVLEEGQEGGEELTPRGATAAAGGRARGRSGRPAHSGSDGRPSAEAGRQRRYGGGYESDGYSGSAILPMRAWRPPSMALPQRLPPTCRLRLTRRRRRRPIRSTRSTSARTSTITWTPATRVLRLKSPKSLPLKHFFLRRSR